MTTEDSHQKLKTYIEGHQVLQIDDEAVAPEYSDSDEESYNQNSSQFIHTTSKSSYS